MRVLLSKNIKEIDWSLWLLSFIGSIVTVAIVFFVIIFAVSFYGKLIVQA